MKKIICILLVLCLCGCSAPAVQETTGTTAAPTIPVAERILGVWNVSIDCSDFCNGYILDYMGQELAVYFDFTGIAVDGIFTLLEDGTFTMTISQEAVDAYTQEIDRIMHSNHHDYLEQAIREELNGRTLDAYLEETGLTMDYLLLAAGINLPLMIQDLLDPLRTVPCSGTYYVQDDLLHIAGTVCDFTLTETTLRIEAPADTTGLASFPALFPLDFTR